MQDLCEVGQEIDALQKAAGVNDQLLAGHLEVTAATVKNWKSGKTIIKSGFMIAIREICNQKGPANG